MYGPWSGAEVVGAVTAGIEKSLARSPLRASYGLDFFSRADTRVLGRDWRRSEPARSTAVRTLRQQPSSGDSKLEALFFRTYGPRATTSVFGTRILINAAGKYRFITASTTLACKLLACTQHADRSMKS